MTPLERQVAQQVQALIAAAPGKVTIVSGKRSIERQTQLWNEALRKYGSPAAASKWVAPPGNSHHNYGTAFDLGFANNQTRSWVHQNAARFGLHFPLGNEPWHIEPQAPGGGRLSLAQARSGQRLENLGHGDAGEGFGGGMPAYDPEADRASAHQQRMMQVLDMMVRQQQGRNQARPVSSAVQVSADQFSASPMRDRLQQLRGNVNLTPNVMLAGIDRQLQHRTRPGGTTSIGFASQDAQPAGTPRQKPPSFRGRRPT